MKEHSARFLAIVTDAKTRIHEMSVHECVARMARQEIILIDIREDHEWNRGHALGAIHIGKGILERDIEAKFPESGTPLALYCGGGYRSALAADALQTMGYSKVWSLAGGFRAWRKDNAPVEGQA